MGFTRMTATKWRLDEDTKRLLGSLLIYMRNEFRAGASAVSYDTPNQQSNAIEGASVNYKKMMQCIDRILSRIDGTWDAHKLTLAYGMLARAIGNSNGEHLSRAIINEAENAYGTLALDSGWDRIDSEGNAILGEPDKPIIIDSRQDSQND